MTSTADKPQDLLSRYVFDWKRQNYRIVTSDGTYDLCSFFTSSPNIDFSGILTLLERENNINGICTVLYAAVMNHRTEIVKLILKKFKINIEQETTVQFDDRVIEGATALWCAAGCESYDIVKLLIEYGADVNHCTKLGSTPLKATCWYGRLDIVKILVENGADIYTANPCEKTYLMIAVQRGYMSIVSYLIEMKVDVNAQDASGRTALHFAAECGDLNTVEVLLKNGSGNLKDKIGMTPLLTAACSFKPNIVEALIKSPLFLNTTECVEGLELLGALYAIDNLKYNLETAYDYLEKAMKIRESNSCLPKITFPLAAYGYHVECQTLEELQAVRNNPEFLHMEALVICERILGHCNPQLPKLIDCRAVKFADNGRFDESLALWFHAFYLTNKNNIFTYRYLFRFAKLFSQMLLGDHEITFNYLEQVLHIALQMLEKYMVAINSVVNDTISVEELEKDIYVVLYLLVISTKLVKKFTSSEKDSLYKLVYAIVKLNVTTQNDSTLLHLSVNADTRVYADFYTQEICKFPCISTTRILIQCGANVNAVDKFGNTPLHIIALHQKRVIDFLTLNSIINLLIESGVHIDVVNKEGKTASDSVLTGVVEMILRPQCQINLKCLAARAVKRYNIPYDKESGHLKVFIDMHGKK